MTDQPIDLCPWHGAYFLGNLPCTLPDGHEGDHAPDLTHLLRSQADTKIIEAAHLLRQTGIADHDIPHAIDGTLALAGIHRPANDQAQGVGGGPKTTPEPHRR